MSTENKIECPALHKRSSSYPFGDRVPRTVRMLKTVTADPMPGIELAYIKGDAPVAGEGQTYPVWTNSHGAVTAIMEDGTRLGLRPAEFEVDSWHDLAAEPAPQHPDPIAWMVGTAFWWTKEEAERDAAATGLPIVGLGPMSGSAPAEQHQVVPVKLPAYKLASQYNSHDWDEGYRDGWGACRDEIAKLGPLYTHSDPSEVERLREDLSKYIARANDFAAKMQGAQSEAGTLRAQLAERDALLDRVVDHAKFWHDHPYAEVVEAIAKDYKALSASAEPSAPTHDPKLISIVHTPPAEYDEP